MTHRYYSEQLAEGCGSIALTDSEAHHLIHVMRGKVGDTVEIFNGRGLRAPGRVHSLARREALIEVAECFTADPLDPLIVAVPIPKGDRAGIMVEKLVEVGVTTLIPLRTERSVTHPREGKLERFERTVIEACKQCGRDELMRIEPLSDWTAAASTIEGIRYFLDLGGTRPRFPTAPAAVTIAVGPEGGWSDSERDIARSHGWVCWRVDGPVLRTETAAVVGAAIVRFASASANC